MKLFSLTRLLLRNAGKRNFHKSNCKFEFYEDPNKEGYRKISDKEESWKKLSLKEKLLLELRLGKEVIKEFKDNFKENLVDTPPHFIYNHHVDVVWRFTGDKNELDNWVITTDKDHNQGNSTATLEFTKESKGLFHGFLDTKLPADGELKKAGMCNLRAVTKFTAFKNIKILDWVGYTHLVLRLRGDGRVYSVNLHQERKFDVCMYDMYHYFIWTRGGPYWQHVRIPFSKFFLGYKGRIPNHSDTMPLNEIKTISFTLADKINGPFQLEIDYIGIENDPSHIEKSAYEHYYFDELMW